MQFCQSEVAGKRLTATTGIPGNQPRTIIVGQTARFATNVGVESAQTAPILFDDERMRSQHPFSSAHGRKVK